MADREILGHIDCPACGTKGGMRITHDKNGEPFGFCEAECNQQMRVGGSARRVALFLKMYPWAGDKKPVPVQVQEKQPEKPSQIPVTVTAEKPPRPDTPKRGIFDMGL